VTTASYTIRDDDRYTVVVGWEDVLETFFARVVGRYRTSGEPIFNIGTRRHEIPAVSLLAEMVSGYASIDAATVSALRRLAPVA
jgi:hypothetical protein